jgi:hypothetical protein
MSTGRGQAQARVVIRYGLPPRRSRRRSDVATIHEHNIYADRQGVSQDHPDGEHPQPRYRRPRRRAAPPSRRRPSANFVTTMPKTKPPTPTLSEGHGSKRWLTCRCLPAEQRFKFVYVDRLRQVMVKARIARLLLVGILSVTGDSNKQCALHLPSLA